MTHPTQSGSAWDEAKKMAMLKAALATGYKRPVHHRVPTLEAVLAAYQDDRIDSYELDTYLEAAVFGRCVEEAAWMRPRMPYKPRRRRDLDRAIRTARRYR